MTRHGGRFETAEEGASDADPGLTSVSETETVGDVVDVRAFARRLPGGWGVVAEVVPFDDEPLTEVLLLRRSPEDPRLLLKPAELSDPEGPVEFYVRRVDRSTELLLTVDSLREGLRAAINWAHQRTESGPR